MWGWGMGNHTSHGLRLPTGTLLYTFTPETLPTNNKIHCEVMETGNPVLMQRGDMFMIQVISSVYR